MYSIGIDQSPNHTGVCALSATGEVLLLALIEPDGLKGVARLAYIRDSLNTMLHGHRAAIGVWESYALKATNRKFDQGEIGGVVQLALFDHAERVEKCAPVALKKFVTENHRADKAAVMQGIKDRWGVKIEDDNLADAYGLAQLGRVLLDTALTTRRAQLEVASRIRKGPAKRSSPYRMRRDTL